MHAFNSRVCNLIAFQILCLLGFSFPLKAGADTTHESVFHSSGEVREHYVVAQTLNNESDNSESEVFRINYLGVGGTIGLVGDADTPVGNGGFSLVGRFSFTDNVSIHTASVIGGDSLFSLALTGGAPIRDTSSGNINVFPFAGAGFSVETDDFTVAPLISAGVDIPIHNLFTGTARVNTNFADEGTDVGFVLGVGVNLFRLF